MAEHSRSTQVGVDADTAFSYLSDVGNLPDYLPRMTEAHRTGDEEIAVTADLDLGEQGHQTVEGQADFVVDDAGRTISWGSQGDKDYGGKIAVERAGDSGSTVTVGLHWHHGDPDDVDADLERSVQKIKANLEGR